MGEEGGYGVLVRPIPSQLLRLKFSWKVTNKKERDQVRIMSGRVE